MILSLKISLTLCINRCIIVGGGLLPKEEVLMGSWEDTAREHERRLLLGDTLGFLEWIIERNGKEAHINNVPISFNSFHWVSSQPGPLLQVQTVRPNVFQFAVTDAGMNFMRQHGWTGKTEVQLLDRSKAMVPEAPKPLKSIWVRDSNRRIYEITDLSRVRPEIIATMRDNNVAVIDSKLYAVSFEDLMGTEEDITLSVQ